MKDASAAGGRPSAGSSLQLVLALLLASGEMLGAQVSLAELQRRAVESDPRARQAALLRSQSALREQSIRAERLPALSIEGLAQYQSDVPSIPIALPGVTPPSPAHDTYDARLAARQRLYDPALGARIGAERAQLAEAQARVRTPLHPLRQAVNDAYFAALLLQTQRGEIALAVTDLEAQLRVARERAAAGTALRGEANAVEAEVLRRRQVLAELDANRRAALDVLADLTGMPLDARDSLAPVALDEAVRAARARLPALGARPELEQFARTRDALAAQEAVVAARERPRVSAFARLGYGRPGLNVLSDAFDTYWLAGVQLEWTPLTWGTTRREREVLALQRELVETEEAAFRAQLARATVQDLATIDRLAGTLADDDRIIALRERILAEARARFAESVITSAEYVDRQTDLVNARLARALHRAELAQAQARLLTTLGLEVR